MGNTQILLIVLGMMIVGLAIAIGIILVRENAISSNRDAIANDLANIAARAQQYYNTPAAMGGGGRSYLGLTADSVGMAKLIPSLSAHNSNGDYTIVRPGTTLQVVLQGVGKEVLSDGSYPTLICVVTPGNIAVTIDN